VTLTLDTNRSVELIPNFLDEYDGESDNEKNVENEKSVKSVKNGKSVKFENSVKL
jgi:hypothetical protein